MNKCFTAFSASAMTLFRSSQIFDDVAEPSIRVYLSQEKKLKFKTACVSRGRDMSDVVNEMIDKWLEENEVPSPANKKDKGG